MARTVTTKSHSCKLKRVKGSSGRTVLDNSSDLSANASMASASEIRESFSTGKDVTVIIDGHIVRLASDGTKTVLGEAARKSRFKSLTNIACHG